MRKRVISWILILVLVDGRRRLRQGVYYFGDRVLGIKCNRGRLGYMMSHLILTVMESLMPSSLIT